MKTLIDLKPGEAATVSDFNGGHKAQIQLKNLGLHIGVKLILQKKSSIGGPLMVSVNGSNIAIGRGIASKIHITTDEHNQTHTADRPT